MVRTAIYDRLGDFINPIAVKEMRQAVKGRILTWMLILFLLAQLVIIGIGMVFSEFTSDSFYGGRTLLSFLLFALLAVCLLCLPAIFGLRLSAERTEGRIDLLFITNMNSYSIIWGKTLAGIGLTLLLFSASMPFLTLTYLLRGVDLPSIFIMMGLNFLVVVLTIQGALFLACFPGGLISRGIRFLFGIGGAIMVMSLMGSLSMELLRTGIGSLMGTWEFWAGTLTVGGFILLAMGFLFVLSAVQISPPSSNRAPAIRGYLVLIWVCTTACCLLWFLKTGEREIALVWLIPMLILFSLSFTISLSERQSYGVRIRRSIPKNRLLRIPLFFFYSGAAGGVLFSAIMLLLTLGGFYLASTVSPTITRVLSEDVHLMILSSCLYLICYGLSALIVRRLFFSPQTSNVVTITIAMILLAVGSLGPFLFAWIFIHHDVDRIPEVWYLGNPLIVFIEKKTLGITLTFTILWALAVFVLNIPWFISQIRGFKPLDIPAEPAQPAPLSDKE
jgi:hypothetical protein